MTNFLMSIIPASSTSNDEDSFYQGDEREKPDPPAAHRLLCLRSWENGLDFDRSWLWVRDEHHRRSILNMRSPFLLLTRSQLQDPIPLYDTMEVIRRATEATTTESYAYYCFAVLSKMHTLDYIGKFGPGLERRYVRLRSLYLLFSLDPQLVDSAVMEYITPEYVTPSPSYYLAYENSTDDDITLLHERSIYHFLGSLIENGRRSKNTYFHRCEVAIRIQNQLFERRSDLQAPGSCGEITLPGFIAWEYKDDPKAYGPFLYQCMHTLEILFNRVANRNYGNFIPVLEANATTQPGAAHFLSEAGYTLWESCYEPSSMYAEQRLPAAACRELQLAFENLLVDITSRLQDASDHQGHHNLQLLVYCVAIFVEGMRARATFGHMARRPPPGFYNKVGKILELVFDCKTQLECPGYVIMITSGPDDLLDQNFKYDGLYRGSDPQKFTQKWWSYFQKYSACDDDGAAGATKDNKTNDSNVARRDEDVANITATELALSMTSESLAHTGKTSDLPIGVGVETGGPHSESRSLASQKSLHQTLS